MWDARIDKFGCTCDAFMHVRYQFLQFRSDLVRNGILKIIGDVQESGCFKQPFKILNRRVLSKLL